MLGRPKLDQRGISAYHSVSFGPAHLAVLGRPKLDQREISAYHSVSFGPAHLAVLGRPKWTRTTDLVLIRHAL